MLRPAYSALASAAVLATFMAQARATELHGYAPAPYARAVAPCNCKPAAGLPRIVYGPALPQYVAVQPSYLVDQGPSDDIPSNPYGIPASPYAPRPAYGYVDTDDYHGAGVGYGGYYAFAAARPHHRYSHESGVRVYRGPSVVYWGAERRAAWRGAHRPWVAERSGVAGRHIAHHGSHNMHHHAGSPRVHAQGHTRTSRAPLHARPAVGAPLRRR